jgi:hypothetical protein
LGILQEFTKGLAIGPVLTHSLLNGVIERGLVDHVRLLGPRGGRRQHHRKHNSEDSPTHLHELPPPKPRNEAEQTRRSIFHAA